jgi:hypothetical protein
MDVSPWLFIVKMLKLYQQSFKFTGLWYFGCCQRIVLILLFLNHFMCKMQSDFASNWTSTHILWMFVSPWLFIVKSLKWYQQSSLYTGWWYFWGCRSICLLFEIFGYFLLKIPSNFTSTWTSAQKLWMYVTPWLFIVKSLKWYQQSSMYTGWW